MIQVDGDKYYYLSNKTNDYQHVDVNVLIMLMWTFQDWWTCNWWFFSSSVFTFQFLINIIYLQTFTSKNYWQFYIYFCFIIHQQSLSNFHVQSWTKLLQVKGKPIFQSIKTHHCHYFTLETRLFFPLFATHLWPQIKELNLGQKRSTKNFVKSIY